MDARLDHIIQRITAICPATAKLKRPDLEDLIKALEPLLLERPHADQLWTLSRLALYLGVDSGMAERLMKPANAPKPFRTPDTHMRVWRAGDLFDWLDRKEPQRLRLVKS